MRLTKLEKAINFALKLHKGQKRVDGCPYINHPMAVMNILQRHGFDEEILIIAILHDICEDTDCNSISITDTFGERVGFAVTSLSKNRKYCNNGVKTDDHDNYRLLMYINRIYLGALSDYAILFVKMADKIDNFGTISVFNTEKQERILNECEKHYCPMFHKISSTLDMDLKSKYNLLNKELQSIYNIQKDRLAISTT